MEFLSMPHTRAKDIIGSLLRVPLKRYSRRHCSHTPLQHLPTPFTPPLRPLLSPILNPTSSPTSDSSEEMADEDELPKLLSRVNIEFPTFKGLSTEDADDHIRRFLSLRQGRGLN